MSMKQIFASRLKLLLAKANIIQTEFCNQNGISYHSFKHYAAPSEKIMPPYEILLKIAKGLNVSLDYLLGTSGKTKIVHHDIYTLSKAELKRRFADNLKSYRTTHDLTQQQAGKLFGTSLEYYQMYEDAKNRRLPKYKNLAKIASACKCTLDDLFSYSR